MPDIKGITEPRIFTPPLCTEWTPKTTDGFQAIKFANECLHLTLFPWQEWLLLHALELDPSTGFYRFRINVVQVARQNGKTLVEIVLALWHIYVKDSRTVIGTAQDLVNAERAWRDAVALAEDDDELRDLIENVYLGHPKEFRLVTGCEYRIAAASRRGGRGFAGDLILLDEIREHRNWDSWAAVLNTMNARPNAQAWAFSNAGDVQSEVLRYLRAIAHRDLGWPDGDLDAEVLEAGDDDQAEIDASSTGLAMGWWEWSAQPSAKRSDENALAQANPSKDHTEITPNCVSMRALTAALKTSPAHVYEQECMCRWTVLGTGGPFPENSWIATQNDRAAPADGSEIAVCVEVSRKRVQTFIARAGLTAEGVAVVGIAADRAGTDWVRDYLLDTREGYAGIVVRAESGSPAQSLIDELIEAELPVVEWKGGDINGAHGVMFDRLRDNTIAHLGHPGLDLAATSATAKELPGGGWVCDVLKSPSDVAPLLAAIGAVWGLDRLPDRESVYATEDVLVLRRRR